MDLEAYKQFLRNKKEEVTERIKYEIKDKGDQVKEQFKDVSEQVTEMGSEVIRNIFGAEQPPNKVLDTKPEAYSAREVHCREDGLILYKPENNPAKKGQQGNYEIVLHRPTTETLSQTYSLFRSPILEEAEMKLLNLKDKLPILIEVSKEVCNLTGIQKICDILSEHPSWSVAHIAAHFGLFEALNNPKVKDFLNSVDDDGVSPLQVAIIKQNLKTVQILIAAGCSLEHVDFNNNSVFHYAASTTKDIICALTQGTQLRSLSSHNKNGHTPLHVACLADKPDCVHALLLAGADVNKSSLDDSDDRSEYEPGYVGKFLESHPNILHNQDMKFGGTPLHWARSRQVIETLVDMNCHINAVNFQKRTALHVMVTRNRLECVVALLSRNADADLGDYEGNRAIHIAVQDGNLSIIQCLIVFGADLDLLNNKGESARHLLAKSKDKEQKLLYYLHAVGAKRCPEVMTDCSEGCKYGGTFDGIPPPSVIGPTNRHVLDQMLSVAAMDVASQKHPEGKIPNRGRLLCLDGGGIRGLILVQMLLELERVLHKPVNFCFDWISGTSTGGILALAIAAGKTLKECQCLYFRLKDTTFVGYRPYGSEPLETVLKDTFGAETVMTDIKHPKLMITGVLGDRKPVELHLFRNYQSPGDILGVKHDSPYELPPPPEEQFIWEVGRATGAAPTYFRAFRSYLDGGLIANNPTLDAMAEIHEHCLALNGTGRGNEASPISVVVSLGTGIIPVKKIELDIFKPESIWDGARLVFGISALGALLVDQATQSDGRVVDRARAWCSQIGVPYFRFSPQMTEDVNMDEKSDEKLCKMLWETKAYMYENMSTIMELADILNK